MTTALGLDIGGANLKSADLDGRVRCVPFPMWTHHLQLADVLPSLSFESQPDLVGVTMTAELADCFATKAHGVGWIVDCVRQAFPQSETRFWLTTGEFAEAEDAADLPELVAAANWHALATWVGRAVPAGPAILIDTGTTTTDIIPLQDGTPLPTGLTDLERLQSGELVYTGVRRTPLCAIRQTVSLNNSDIPLAAEVFATSLDAHLLLGHLSEEPDNRETADGEPATAAASHRRLARMLCSDADAVSPTAARQLARQFCDTQRDQLTSALQRVIDRQLTQSSDAGPTDTMTDPAIIVSGSGSFLAEQAVQASGLTPFINVQESSSTAVAEAACAFAIARLVTERCRDDLLATVPFV